MISRWSVWVFLVAIAFPVGAQITECEPTDTLESCWARFFSPMAPADAAKLQDESLAVKTTSPDASGVDNASSLKDFLPLFRVLLTNANIEEKEDSIVLEFNLPFLDIRKRAIQVQTIFHEPEPFEPLLTAVPEASRSEAAARLKDELDDLDDLEIALSWSLNGSRWGRDWDNHRQAFQGLYNERINSLKEEALDKIFGELSEPFKEYENLDQILIGEIEDKVPGYSSRLALTALAEFNTEKKLRALMWAGGLFSFADLVSNQPQFYISAGTRQRAPEVGPDAWTAKAAFEMGWVNVNSYSAYCRESKREKDLDCLGDYLKDPRVAASLERGDRLSFSVEYQESDQYEFSLPNYQMDYGLEGTRQWKASLTYGRILRTDDQGKDLARLDIMGRYEDHSADALKNDRALLVVTYTQRISDQVVIPLTLTYANKPEYLEGSKAHFGAHVGLSFKLPEKVE